MKQNSFQDDSQEHEVHAILDKVMNEGGEVKWVCDWGDNDITKNDDVDMDDCTGLLNPQTGIWENGLLEEFEAQHESSCENVVTIHEETFKASPYAAHSGTYHELIVEVWKREMHLRSPRPTWLQRSKEWRRGKQS